MTTQTEDVLLFATLIFMGCSSFVGLYLISCAIDRFARVLAKLPTHLEQKREILLPPKEAAREGDVKFHFPPSIMNHDD